MRKIKAKPITVENFAPYGCFANVLNPKGNHLGDFYNDQVLMPVSGGMPIGFSPLVMNKPEKMIVSAAEYHNTTGEGIIALDDDIILHVAPATKVSVPELTEAFIVPKGAIVKLNAGVWHFGPLPVNSDIVHILIILPERIYANDCIVVEYALEDQFEIEL